MFCLSLTGVVHYTNTLFYKLLYFSLTLSHTVNGCELQGLIYISWLDVRHTRVMDNLREERKFPLHSGLVLTRVPVVGQLETLLKETGQSRFCSFTNPVTSSLFPMSSRVPTTECQESVSFRVLDVGAAETGSLLTQRRFISRRIVSSILGLISRSK